MFKEPSAKLRSNQSGLASFLVALVMMLVITLIVLSFSQIARRDQSEALDNQLSTQAYYAAESGVNLVQHLVQVTPVLSTLDKTSCTTSTAPYAAAQLSIAASNVANTCLLVNPAPPSLVYGTIGTSSTVVPLQSATPTGPGGHITLTWVPESAASGAAISKCPTASPTEPYGTFPAADSWPHCPFGVLRFDMVDITAAGPTLTEAGLESQSSSVFAPPTSTAQNAIVKAEGSLAASPGAVLCTDSSCSLTISNINFSHTYYLRLTSLYKDVTMSSITGYSSSQATAPDIQFVGAQTLVDSTGRAVDVLRRVQVRLDDNNVSAPPAAIEGTTGVCKQYTTDGTTVSPGSC